MSSTKVKLGVTRTIKTADFESLHIIAEIEETVNWSSEAERAKGVDSVVNHLVGDFAKGYNSITGSIGVKRSLAVGKLENKMTGKTHVANVEEDGDEVDIF